VNICIATNDEWVRESLEKNLIGNYGIHHVSSEITEINDKLLNLDYFFVDMQFCNSGGPATIRKIKELFSKNGTPAPQLVLLADREVDIFQGKRAGANEVIVKPLTASKIKKILTK
tara:strand:- start:238 stop:585 length:348 start_codon:yes stop_codon:yes gene_type:complete